jgi:hypothetical protein
MLVPIVNILLGVAAVVAGASGQFSLAGTHNPELLLFAGAAVAALGFFQLIRAMRGR